MPRSHFVVPSPKGWQVQPWRLESLKHCRLYLLSSCLGGFAFVIFFSHLSFFWLFFFFFSSCVYVSVCFVFSAGLGVGGVFLLALTFHRKRGPGAGWVACPGRRSRAWEETFLIPDTRTVPDKCLLDPLVLIPQRNGLQGTCRA